MPYEATQMRAYLNGMTRIGLSKKTGMGIRKALHEDTMQRQMARIQREPGFKNLAALPDDELRALAAGEGGRALADSFIREIAREGQIAASAQPQQQPARRQPAQPNAEAAAEPVLQ